MLCKLEKESMDKLCTTLCILHASHIHLLLICVTTSVTIKILYVIALISITNLYNLSPLRKKGTSCVD